MSTTEDLQRRAGAQVLYLTTTGRKSGLARTIEIWFAATEDKVYIMSGAGKRSHWVQNIAARSDVSLSIDGAGFRGTARALDGRRDRAAWATAKRLFQEKYDWTIGRGVVPVEVTVDSGPVLDS